jgi:hypothetical protein
MVISISFFMYDLHLYLMMMVTCLAGKKVSKAPKIQRLVTPQTVQRKRARVAEKKKRIAKKQAEAAEYQKLLARGSRSRGSAATRAWPSGGPGFLLPPRLLLLPPPPKDDCVFVRFRCFGVPYHDQSYSIRVYLVWL